MTSPLQDMFRTIVKQLALVTAALAILGGLVGYLVAGGAGLWGALMGAGIVAFFMLTSAAVMLATAEKSTNAASGAFIGSWLIKVILVFVALVALRGADFYAPKVFFVVFALAIITSIAIELRAVWHARVPYVDPSAGRSGPRQQR